MPPPSRFPRTSYHENNALSFQPANTLYSLDETVETRALSLFPVPAHPCFALSSRLAFPSPSVYLYLPGLCLLLRSHVLPPIFVTAASPAVCLWLFGFRFSPVLLSELSNCLSLPRARFVHAHTHTHTQSLFRSLPLLYSMQFPASVVVRHCRSLFPFRPSLWLVPSFTPS